MPEILIHKPEKIAGLLKDFGFKTDHGRQNVVYLVWEAERIKSLFSQITLTSLTPLTQGKGEDIEKVNEVNEVNVESQKEEEDSEVIEVLGCLNEI